MSSDCDLHLMCVPTVYNYHTYVGWAFPESHPWKSCQLPASTPNESAGQVEGGVHLHPGNSGRGRTDMGPRGGVAAR